MKKIGLLLIALFSTLNQIFAQARAMNDVYEDAREAEPLTAMDVIYGVLFLLILLCIYKVFTSKSKVSKKRYRITRNISIITFVFFLVFIPGFNDIKLSNKYHKMYERTKEFVLSYSPQSQFISDNSINLSNNYVKGVEIQDFLFFETLDDESDRFYIHYFGNENEPFTKRYSTHPYSDTVFSTYSITHSPKIELWNTVSSSGTTVNHHLKVPIHYNQSSNVPHIMEETSPYLLQVTIRPERIRYFQNEGDISSDIIKAFENYLLTHFRYGIYDKTIKEEIINFNKNPYFEITWAPNGITESIQNKEIRYTINNYNAKKNIEDYLYDIINYGTFEMIYSISDIRFWTINAKWNTKKFLFWEITKDNWYDCQFTFVLCKYFFILFLMYSFVVLYLIKLKKRIDTE